MHAILWTFVACLTGDYQAVAEQMPWTWSDKQAQVGYSMERCTDCDVVNAPDGLFKKGRGICLFPSYGAPFAFQVHDGTAFVARDTTLLLTDFHPAATGCDVVAIDLTTGKTLWKIHLKGVGEVEHSKYRNAVNMEIMDEVLIVRGNESSGRYIEILDVKTGKTVGHRVYTDGAR